jgi:hypothetical protein
MHRRHSIVLTAFLSTSIVALAGTGCRQEATPPAPAVSERPTPEKSFAEIVDVFKNGMEIPGSNTSGFLTESGSASSRFQVHNTVTSRLIPPTGADDFYHGMITVSSQSIYSLRRSAEEEAEKEQPNAAEGNGFGTMEEGHETGTEFQSFDGGLVTDPTSSDEAKSETDEPTVVQRRPDQVDRVYELVYRGGRWELASKLDPKTEASVANAFDRALRLQP